MANDSRQLERRFEAAHFRAHVGRNYCEHCGDPICPSRSRKGYGCAICDTERHIPDWMGDRGWQVLSLMRRQGYTARRAFNVLTPEAKIGVMRNLRTLLDLHAYPMCRRDRRLSRTAIWLRDGLKPGRL